MYVELVEKTMSSRGNIVPLSSVTTEKREHQAYISMFVFPSLVLESAKQETFSYYGPVSATHLWLDFDCPDIEIVTDEVVEFSKMLNKDYGIAPETLSLYFSGGKGYHIGIPRNIIGLGNGFTSDLPAQFKNIAQRLKGETFMSLDTVIYNHTRIFRLPNSWHPKTGLYKTAFTIEEIETYGIDFVMEEAEAGRDIIRPIKGEFSEALNKLLHERVNIEPPKIQSEGGSLFAIPDKGGRNNTLYKQAYRLFSIGKQRELRLNREEIEQIMRNQFDLTNIMYPGDPVSEKEFETLLQSAIRRSTTNNEGTKAETRQFSDLARSAAETLFGTTPLETEFEEFNEALGGGFKKGNFYPFIGMRQTAKSMLAEQFLSDFAKQGRKVAYFQGEMSDVQVLDRGAKRELGINFEKDIFDGLIQEEDVHRIASDLERAYKGNLFYIGLEEMTMQTIETSLDHIEEQENEIDIVVIDSFNRFTLMNDSEYQTNMFYAKRLKSLAKRRNCVVILIVHCNSQAERYYRDNSGYIRGGSKIADESDGYFCFSGIIDPGKSQLGFKEGRRLFYYPNLYWCMYQDKRSGGKRVDLVLQMSDRLRMSKVDGEASEWESNFS